MPENEQKIWMHYVDKYTIPNQIKIVEILRKNTYLIYNSTVPDSVNLFLDYVLGWELLDNQKRNGVQNYYDYHYSYNYPKEFNYYIRDTLAKLRKEQAELTVY